MKTVCEKNKYHDWQVVSVGACLPRQEVELSCTRCDAVTRVDFDYHGEDE
jgi:hypothetical protein